MKKIHILLIAFAMIHSSFQIANAQWQSNGPAGQNIQCLAINGPDIFAGAANGGVFLSTNNGGAWTAEDNGIATGIDSSFALNITSLAVSGSNIFAGTFAGVFLSNDNGANWRAMNNGLTDTFVNCLAISGSNIFAGTNGGVFLSTDNGASWTAKNTGLTIPGTYVLAANGSELFAVTKNGSLSGVTSEFLSANNGESWELDTTFPGLNVTSVVFKGAEIFTGCIGSYGGNVTGLYLSSDNGVSWTLVGLTDTSVASLVISGSNIFAGTDNGVFLSSNNGAGWTSLGLADTVITSLAVDDSSIFAGTQSYGVWQRSLTGISTGIQPTPVPVQSQFKVYPNPSVDNWQLTALLPDGQVGNELLGSGLEVYDEEGRLVFQTKIQNQQSELTLDVAKGVYFVRIGGMVQKLVKM